MPLGLRGEDRGAAIGALDARLPLALLEVDGRQFVTIGEPGHCRREAQALGGADILDDVTRRPTPEAMIDALGIVDPKTRCVFNMKRAKTNKFVTGFAQFDPTIALRSKRDLIRSRSSDVLTAALFPWTPPMRAGNRRARKYYGLLA